MMRPVRRLSDVEATFAAMHAELRGSTQVTTLLELDGLVSEAEARDAVNALRAQFEILRVAIARLGGDYWFVGGAGAPALAFEPLRFGESSDDRLMGELAEVLASAAPPWRMSFAPDVRHGKTSVFFTRNHAISDGHTTAVILSALLRFLAGRPHSVSCPVGPGVDAYRYLGPRRSEDHGSAAAPRAPPPLTPHDASRGMAERRPDFVGCTVPDGAAVRAYCAAAGISVNTFFAAGFVNAYAAVTGRREVNLFTAVSLRRRLCRDGAPRPAMVPEPGCFIGVHDAAVEVESEALLGTALGYQRAFAARDALWRPLRRDHAAIRAAVDDTGRRAGYPGICITNLGALDGMFGIEAARLQGFRTVVNRTAANYGVVLHLSSLKGSFTAALAFGSPSVDRRLVQEVAAGLSVEVAAACAASVPARRSSTHAEI